jgi:hypothetical protein
MVELRVQVDELVQVIRMTRFIGMPFKLDYNLETSVQSLTVAGKTTRYLKGKEMK